MSLSLLIPLLALAATPKYAESKAEKEARKTGRSVVRELPVDIDGDRKDEIAVVERDKNKAMRVAILRPEGDDDDPTFTEIASSTPRRADRLARLEAKDLTSDRLKEVVAVFEEQSPDDLVQHVRIMGKVPGGVGELFAQSFYVPKGAEVEGKTVALGDGTPRFAIRELPSEDGGAPTAEISWVRGPQTLLLGGGPELVSVVIGAYETVFHYQSGTGTFVGDPEPHVVDFLPRKPAWTVEATAQVPKIWGTAQAFWASDGDLATSWSVTNKKLGVGESLTINFKEPTEISLVQIVPGCAADQLSWETGDRLVAVNLDFSSGTRISLDRDDLKSLSKSAEGAGEFPLGAAGFGSQLIVLLRERTAVKWARLTITKVSPSSKKGAERETCVAEISFH